MRQQSTPLDLNELLNLQPNEPTNFPNHFGATAGPITPSYHIPDTIFRIMVEHYTEQLAAKDSEIKVLSDKLSKLEDNSQQLSSELEQIKNQYREKVTKIPEVQQVLWNQNQGEIQFIVVLDDMSRDISDQLDDIEDLLEDNYTNWIFDFEYVGHRISSQQHQNIYIEIFARD